MDDEANNSGSPANSALLSLTTTYGYDLLDRAVSVTDPDGNISEISRRCGLARHQVRGHLRKLGLMS